MLSSETTNPPGRPVKPPPTFMNHPKNKTLHKSLNRIAADPRVAEVWDEYRTGDGLWISLKPGWHCDHASVVHEWTVRDLIRSFRDNVREGPAL